MTVVPTDAGFFTDKGPHRMRNEDVALASVSDGIFIVADGLGGAAAGDRASRVATDTLSSALREHDTPQSMIANLLPDDETRSALEGMLERQGEQSDHSAHLRVAFLVAHCSVLAEARRTGSIGMATAIVVAWRGREGFWIGHVGDCRAYSLLNGSLKLMTRDHSLSKALEGRKSLPKGVADSAFLRSRLTQVVGGECAPTPDLQEWKPTTGASLLLCSDGVWGSLTDDDLLKAMTGDTACESISHNLVDAAIRAGSRDNATALVVRF
jgi:protein phosphatase